MRKLTVLFIALLYSCSPEPQTLCNYAVAVVERSAEKDEYKPYTDIVLYAFYCDTLNYNVSSYENALSGQITNTKTQQLKSYDIRAIKQDTSFIAQNINSSPITLVLCDTLNKIYAYKQNTILGGLNSIFIKLEIEPYKTESNKIIKKNGWIIKR